MMNIRKGLLVFFALLFILSTIYNIYSNLSSGQITETFSGFYGLSVVLLVIACLPDINNKHEYKVGILFYRLFIFLYAVVLITFMIKYHAFTYLFFFETAMVIVTGILVISSIYKLKR